MKRKEKIEAFGRLLDIMDDLRAKCPWDKKQTFESLRILTIEETYELADAILEKHPEGIEEEIGDIMLHMIFYAKIGEEMGQFNIGSSLNKIAEKLIRRHPHIYGDLEVSGEEEVKLNWEKIKLKEGKKSVLEGVPNSLPAMIKAYRMQEKTKQVGFEWENAEQVWDKVEEEINEMKEAVSMNKSKEEIQLEFGDVLFSLINYARFLKIDPEAALEQVNSKFKKRFEYIETHAKIDLNLMNLTELDALWVEAKQHVG